MKHTSTPCYIFLRPVPLSFSSFPLPPLSLSFFLYIFNVCTVNESHKTNCKSLRKFKCTKTMFLLTNKTELLRPFLSRESPNVESVLPMWCRYSEMSAQAIVYWTYQYVLHFTFFFQMFIIYVIMYFLALWNLVERTIYMRYFKEWMQCFVE